MRYERTINRTKITIDLPSGVYLFNGHSATGKTRLFRMLRDLQLGGESVFTYTYDDKLLFHLDLAQMLGNENLEIVMLDRYDMYLGDALREIRNCANNAVVLIDCKSEFPGDFDYEIASIEMEKNNIEVME